VVEIYTDYRSNRSINVGRFIQLTYNGQCANLPEAHAVLAQTVSTWTDEPWTRILLQKLTVTQLVKKFLNFMKREGSLPHPQHPASSPCHDPDKSNPRPPALCKSKDWKLKSQWSKAQSTQAETHNEWHKWKSGRPTANMAKRKQQQGYKKKLLPTWIWRQHVPLKRNYIPSVSLSHRECRNTCFVTECQPAIITSTLQTEWAKKMLSVKQRLSICNTFQSKKSFVTEKCRPRILKKKISGVNSVVQKNSRQYRPKQQTISTQTADNIDPNSRQYRLKQQTISTQTADNIDPNSRQYRPKQQTISTQTADNIDPNNRQYRPKQQTISTQTFCVEQ